MLHIGTAKNGHITVSTHWVWRAGIISTMRRRPLRTALTATTIIMLTFTILYVTLQYHRMRLALLAEEVENLNAQAGETVLQLMDDPSQTVDGEAHLLLWVFPLALFVVVIVENLLDARDRESGS